MKVRNLLLASLAVAAMTACSNDIDEIVDNGNQTAEGNASMQLNFSFPETGTRAAADKDAGTEFEYNVSEVTAILEYTETNKRKVVQGIKVKEGPNADKVVTATTDRFEVNAGTISKIYVIINNKDANVTSESDLSKLTVSTQDYTLSGEGLDYLTSTIAKNSNFLMSGISTTPVRVVAGTDAATATISVNRVCAKLDETTDANKQYDLVAENAVVSKNGKKVTVKITEHSYTNLNANSYVFARNNESWSGSTLQAYKSTNTFESYNWIAAGATYSLENITGTSKDSWNRDEATSVLYKGQVCLGDDELKGHFYVSAQFDKNDNSKVINTLYANWAELQADYNFKKEDGTVMSENDITEKFLKDNAIIQYSAGVCYYDAAILTDNSTTDIVRNNWYQLKVNSIKDLGTPTPNPKEDPEHAYLILSVSVQPWTVQANNFDL